MNKLLSLLALTPLIAVLASAQTPPPLVTAQFQAVSLSNEGCWDLNYNPKPGETARVIVPSMNLSPFYTYRGPSNLVIFRKTEAKAPGEKAGVTPALTGVIPENTKNFILLVYPKAKSELGSMIVPIPAEISHSTKALVINYYNKSISVRCNGKPEVIAPMQSLLVSPKDGFVRLDCVEMIDGKECPLYSQAFAVPTGGQLLLLLASMNPQNATNLEVIPLLRQPPEEPKAPSSPAAK